MVELAGYFKHDGQPSQVFGEEEFYKVQKKSCFLVVSLVPAMSACNKLGTSRLEYKSDFCVPYNTVWVALRKLFEFQLLKKIVFATSGMFLDDQ